MIPIPSGVRVWIATGHTDMRRGMNGLALQVQQALQRDPHAGDLFAFQDSLARRSRHVALRQAIGARQVHLAVSGRWCRRHHTGAACLYVGGY